MRGSNQWSDPHQKKGGKYIYFSPDREELLPQTTLIGEMYVGDLRDPEGEKVHHHVYRELRHNGKTNLLHLFLWEEQA